MYEFINGLNETRLFQHRDSLDGKTAKDLSNTTYLMLLVLEILRHENKKFAVNYARKTMVYDDFSKMRSNTSDLHNLISILSHQADYEHTLATDSEISPPVFALKRYFRDIAEGRKDSTQDRQLFLKLESALKVHDSALKSIRRHAVDWASSNETERKAVKNNVRVAFQKLSWQNDLYGLI